MIPHELPLQKVEMPIMTYQGAEYLVVVDYHSKYRENMPFNSYAFGKFAQE